MRSVSRSGRVALWCVALWLSAIVLNSGPALADNTGNGSKNFRAPTTVPNYFSNEAGPMLGGPVESRRVDLYPNPGTAPRQVDTVTARPSARSRYIATQHGRVRLAARARGGRYPAAAHGRTRTHLAARGGPPSHAKHAAVNHGTHVSNVHHRGRG